VKSLDSCKIEKEPAAPNMLEKTPGSKKEGGGKRPKVPNLKTKGNRETQKVKNDAVVKRGPT